jgi:hypothetical protein
VPEGIWQFGEEYRPVTLETKVGLCKLNALMQLTHIFKAPGFNP